MEQERRISILKIMWTDYPAFYASLVPAAAWIIYFAWFPNWGSREAVISPSARPIYMTLILLATACGTTVLAGRVWLIMSVFHNGLQVRGKISQIELRRDHGRVHYAYIYEHKEYFSSAAIHRNAETKALRNGEHVMLIVDRSKPARAFIRDLYTRP